MADETAPPGDKKAAAETAPPSGGRTASDLREVADAVRSRTDLFGKTLAAIATLGTTAVGLSKIGDLFPHAGHRWLVVASCVGLALAAGAAIWVAVRLMRVARPVFISADLAGNKDLDEAERREVRPVFEEAARRFGYPTMMGLQERERTLRVAASSATEEDERVRRTALADEVKTEIEQATARSTVVVIRRRSSNAVSDWLSWILYAVVISGLIIFALGTDKISSDRKGIAEAKACGEARKAGATPKELEDTKLCEGEGDESEEQPQQPSADQARLQLGSSLIDALSACAALVAEEGNPEGGPLKEEDCDPIRSALMTYISSPTSTTP
jgi:hypothetical protein